MGWVVNATPRPFYLGNDPVPIVQEAERAPGSWTGAENLPSPGFDHLTVQPIASDFIDRRHPVVSAIKQGVYSFCLDVLDRK